MINTVNMLLGEERNVTIAISSTCCKVFEVTSAKYTLKCGSEIEASGECSIKSLGDTKTQLTALVKPMRKNAVYLLEFNYSIHPETFIYQVRIRVS